MKRSLFCSAAIMTGAMLAGGSAGLCRAGAPYARAGYPIGGPGRPKGWAAAWSAQRILKRCTPSPTRYGVRSPPCVVSSKSGQLGLNTKGVFMSLTRCA